MELKDRIGQLSQAKQLALRKLLENKDIGDDALLSLAGSNVRMLREGEPKLFLYPATDGSVGYMRHYLPHVPEHWGVYALQTPGLEGEQEPYRTIADIARHGIARMREVQPTGPYYIAGHCMGGLPAYETARQLSESGDEVGLVLHLYPIFNRPWKDLPTAQDELQLRAILDYCYIIEHLLDVKIDLPVEALAALGREAQMDRVIEEFRRHNYLGSADPEIIRTRMAIYQANLSAMLTYRPPSVFPGNVTILAAGQKRRGDMVIDPRSPYAAPLRSLREDQVETILVEADEGAMFDGSEPHISAIGREIRRVIGAL
ncbi:thioesterase domain-containing protein [Streptomyces sp. NPDC005805]|uniref:thioesterase domain-containing protein n=1 Tax=Streptomyces sp. NPDC005805 TaxID=3157068 RepID=UPI0033ED5D05